MKQPNIDDIRKALPLSKSAPKPTEKKEVLPLSGMVRAPKAAKIKYKLVSQTNAGKQVSAYIILHPSGKHIATIHIYYSRVDGMWIDIFDGATLLDQYQGKLIHHYEGPAENYPFPGALSGIILADVRLYESNQRITQEEKTVSGFERDYYLPGLDRLKAAGYNVIKAI